MGRAWTAAKPTSAAAAVNRGQRPAAGTSATDTGPLDPDRPGTGASTTAVETGVGVGIEAEAPGDHVPSNVAQPPVMGVGVGA